MRTRSVMAYKLVYATIFCATWLAYLYVGFFFTVRDFSSMEPTYTYRKYRDLEFHSDVFDMTL